MWYVRPQSLADSVAKSFSLGFLSRAGKHGRLKEGTRKAEKYAIWAVGY